MKNIKRLLLLGCSILFLTSCSTNEANLKKYSMKSTELGFDTMISFVAYTENESTFKNYEDILKSEFKRYDRLFDKYNSYSNIANIKTINDNAGIKPVKVDTEIIELLQLAKQYDSLSNHKFDVTMGAVLNIWHDAREAGLIANKANIKSSVPNPSELDKANSYTGFDTIEINDIDNTIYIKNKQTQLDVGGIAKGFTVEKISKLLESKGLKHAIIDGGGNVRLIGNKPASDTWSVGMQIPNLKEYATDSLVSVKINTSSSFVTSGDYQRFYMYGDQIMHHIIDPSTLQPARHCRSVTVVCEDSSIADILSTTLYTMSHKEGQLFLDELKSTEGIEANAIWVYDDLQKVEDNTTSITSKGYTLIISDGLKDKIKK